ncbi:MAG: hypothetical protein WD555_03850, partial [Fulvivirga sp.]
HCRASPERLHSDSQAARILPLTLPPFSNPWPRDQPGFLKDPSVNGNETLDKYYEHIEGGEKVFSSQMQN